MAMERFDADMLLKQIEQSDAALMHLCRKHGMPETTDLCLTWLDSAMTALKAERDAAVARAESPEQALADKILAELVRARTKFPGKNVTFAALVEEVGELATATFEESAERVEKEAVQVAVMAMRMVLDGDHCFDGWRKEKGLDALDPAARAAPPEAKGEK